jgi:rubrerythrin
MFENFSATDIVEIAIELEKNGRSFYENFACKTKDKTLTKFFSDMAEEEAQHESDFKVILSRVMNNTNCDTYPQEYFAYLNAIAGGYLFKDNDVFRERIAAIDTKKDAVDFSLGIEKDSILLYEEMKKIVPDKDRPLIEDIIKQERLHVEKLWGIRKTEKIGG